jgi:translation initiation factor 1
MAASRHKTILFLCTGNYYRSRFAEILFNAVAGKMGLSWQATSRALALERGVNNIGPMSEAAKTLLAAMGVSSADAFSRFPVQVTAADLEQADLIVALKQVEHLPLLQERFPIWAEKVEFWHMDDVPSVLPLVEREVMDLVARLLGGGQRPTSAPPDAVEKKARPEKQEAVVVRVGRETKGRRGKGVTIVADVPLDEEGLRELAAKLKQKCGTGGTVKEGRIEIQGDQRERISAELEAIGYKVKRSGG